MDLVSPSVLAFCLGLVTDVRVKHRLTGVIKMKIESLVWDKGKGNEALQVEQLIPGSCI